MKKIIAENNRPFYIHTDRLLCVECCNCGMMHYESFAIISGSVIEITMNSKKGVVYVKGVQGEHPGNTIQACIDEHDMLAVI